MPYTIDGTMPLTLLLQSKVSKHTQDMDTANLVLSEWHTAIGSAGPQHRHSMGHLGTRVPSWLPILASSVHALRREQCNVKVITLPTMKFTHIVDEVLMCSSWSTEVTEAEARAFASMVSYSALPCDSIDIKWTNILWQNSCRMETLN